jgi:DNA-binding winged helix-turn-helix (wHTH) protein
MTMRAIPDDARAGESLRIRFDTYELDEGDARLTRNGQPVPLAPRPFAVLCALARAPQTLVTKNALLDTVWGHRFVSDSVLKTTVSALRAALDDDPKQPRYIETVSRRGYRFIGAVAARPALGASMARTTSVTVSPPAAASPIVGRSDAIERLRAAWQLARAGRRRIVWVAGEPGVGKTTLIEHFAGEVGEMYCAHGQCVGQLGAGEPYLPVLEALSGLCRRDPSFAQLIRAVAPTWFLQLPWLTTTEERDALRRDLSGSGPAHMLREFGELLERHTEDQPLLLVTEDLHWSDAATLQLMDHTARRRGAAHFLWLASFRLTEIMAADHPLKSLRHELRLHGLSEEIVLDAFSEAEVADYVAKRLPGLAAEESFVQALHARTDGLPLFVADVVKDLMTPGDSAQQSEASAQARLESMPIPENLAGIIEQYMQRLAPDERALLEAASICGVEFGVNAVAGVLESDIAGVSRSCAELARLQCWVIDVPLEQGRAASHTRYAFRHALYREVLQNRIDPVACAELHRKVAVALERERAHGAGVTAAELASHFELGHQPAQALRYYTEAAESSLAQFRAVHTLALTDRALALLPAAGEVEDRTQLEMTLMTLRGAAAIHAHGISSVEVKDAFGRAQSLLEAVPLHPLRGLLLQPLGAALFMRAELDEAEALALRSETLSARTHDLMALLCACFTHGVVQHVRGRPGLARAWFEKALAAGARLDESEMHATTVADPSVLTLGLLAVDLLHLGRVKEGRARLCEAQARARELRAPAPRMAVLWLEALFEVRLENVPRVAAIADELQKLEEEFSLAHAMAACLWFRGWSHARTGDPRAGHALIREGYSLAVDIGTRAYASETLGYAAEALALAGDWPAARHAIEEAMECAEAIGERVYWPQLWLLEARIADAFGEQKRAAESIRRAVAEARSQEAPWLEMLALAAHCARKDATAQDRQALRRALEQVDGTDTAPVKSAQAVLAGSRA